MTEHRHDGSMRNTIIRSGKRRIVRPDSAERFPCKPSRAGHLPTIAAMPRAALWVLLAALVPAACDGGGSARCAGGDDCGGACVDLATDRANCGACGVT